MTERTVKGRFKPGTSGNASGRPKGARNKASLAVEALLEGEAEGLTRKAIELAQEGDTTALKLCLERLYAPRRGRSVNLQLPSVENAAGVAEAMRSVLEAVSFGQITIDEARTLSAVLETRRKAIETADFESRIKQLEERSQ